jgi:hypothetical protein
MDRMRHSTARAAMIYLHGSDARQREIADTLSKLTRQGLKRGGRPTVPAPIRSHREHNGDGQVIEHREPQRPEQDSNLRPSA